MQSTSSKPTARMRFNRSSASAALVICIVFSGGAGVDVNVFFDTDIALSLAIALALERAQSWGAYARAAIAVVLLIPLALTSTKGWIRRLGGKRWQALHRLIYVSALCGVVHYYWLVKSDHRLPLLYGAVLAVLLLYRLGVSFLKPRPVVAVSPAS